MRPPPRWVRRLLLAPLAVVLSLALVVSAPLWLLISTAVSPLAAGRLRPVRVLWLATVYLLVEAAVLVTMFALWIASGFGARVRSPAFQRAHYVLCGRALAVLYRQAKWVLRLTVQIDGATPDSLPDERPLLVFSRHAGPGDSFLLAHALIAWYAREPRIVVKDSLQWDPAIDVLLNRLPNRFIAPGGGHGAEAQIGDLAHDLDGNDALVIFPEGGNFTPERWRRGVARLRRMGFASMARRAERMRNVLPPRPGGVLAALDASPHAHVVLVGHTGVDHLRTIADVWRELPMDKSIVMHWWLVDPSDIPTDPDARIEWLYGWWARVDDWISQHKVTQAIPTAG
ncbi:MAG TPA: 1-acyl-sn-glycerol-3-phosphate acyltransferase [Micromonosporaceae bacterium]|jgi:1-acyl-sn-glycerol-3-phosphate acyltransferase|nr:1-acyl-sn-glycerol-3-phosphate acyltransferase [Micromonosporaceae bacterium]